MFNVRTFSISKLSGCKFKVKISTDRFVALLFSYIYGIYGFNKIDPIWGNLDGKIFYIGSQTVIFLSIFLVFFHQIRYLSNEKERKDYFIIDKYHIAYFMLFSAFFLALNRTALKNDLYGDETAYAKYSYWHFEKITNVLLSRFPSLGEIKQNTLIQLVGLAVVALSIIIALSLMKLPLKSFYFIVIISTITFRILNLLFFEFENENPEPFLIVHQGFLSIFGINSLSFRLGTILIFVIFSITLLNEVIKLVNNTLLSLIATLAFLSTPLILTTSTKLDHGMFTFFSYSFILLWWLDGWRKPILDRKVFLLASIYLSFTNFLILVILAVILTIDNYLRHKCLLRTFKFSNLGVLVYALPFLTIHLFRIIKSSHITNEIDNDALPTFIERVSLTWRGIFVFTDTYTLVLVIIGCLSFVVFKRNPFNSLFLIFVFLSYAFFTAPGALGWNRYYLQWLIPLLLFLYISILKATYVRQTIVSGVLVIILLINMYHFKSFSDKFSNFDNFVVKENWDIDQYNIQPKNVIWPGTFYEEALYEFRSLGKESKCLIIGNFWSAVPETLSGYSARTIIDLQHTYELNRKVLDQLMSYRSNSQELDLSNIDCLFLVAAGDKNQLLEYLVKNGWSSIKFNQFWGNYNFYVLQKSSPFDRTIFDVSSKS